MSPPSPNDARTRWLTRLGWWVFWGWFMGLILMGGRWWWSKTARDRLASILAAPTVTPTHPMVSLAPQQAKPPAPAPPTTPSQDLPVLRNQPTDPMGRFHLEKALAEFLSQIPKDGEAIDFLRLMQAWEVPGASTMTQAEAAAEFLRRSSQFSELIADWKASLDLAPWDAGQSDGWLGSLGARLAGLLGAVTQAHWRTGNDSAAMASWELLNATRLQAGRPPFWLQQETIRLEWNQTLRAGLSLGAWNDDQLTSLARTPSTADPLATEHALLQSYRSHLTDHFDSYSPLFIPPRTGGTLIPAESFRRLLDVTLISERQRADNLALVYHALDHALDRFDPTTGQLLPPHSAASAASGVARLSDSWFDRQYFYTARMAEQWLTQSTENVVTAHTESNHARLALALEAHRRQTGSLPETLHALAPQFPGGLPKDIATGQDYFYAREPDGGYIMWGLGVNQTNDSHDPSSDDVAWRQPPPRSRDSPNRLQPGPPTMKSFRLNPTGSKP